LQKLMQLIKTMLTKKSEKQFCKDFEPRLGGGQKYSKNKSKSSNKRKCHKGWSLWRSWYLLWCWAPTMLGNTLRGSVRCQIAMDCKGCGWKRATRQSGRREPTSPSYRSDLKKIWLNPDVYSTKMANRQQKWIQWNWFLMKKVPLCNAKRLSQVADLGDEPVTCDDEGPKVCQNPVRGGRWLTVNTIFLLLGKE
jgi:hypothetical protein